MVNLSKRSMARIAGVPLNWLRVVKPRMYQKKSLLSVEHIVPKKEVEECVDLWALSSLCAVCIYWCLAGLCQ